METFIGVYKMKIDEGHEVEAKMWDGSEERLIEIAKWLKPFNVDIWWMVEEDKVIIISSSGYIHIKNGDVIIRRIKDDALFRMNKGEFDRLYRYDKLIKRYNNGTNI